MTICYIAPLLYSTPAINKIIAPSLPFQGDQAVDAHAARAPPPPYSWGGSGLSYHVFRGAMTGLYLASW